VDVQNFEKMLGLVRAGNLIYIHLDLVYKLQYNMQTTNNVSVKTYNKRHTIKDM
jgi:hypothetical protein